jgi:hypothetical protein
MRNAMWLAGCVLSCTCASAAVAVDTIPLREPTPGPHEFYKLHEQVLQKPPVQGQRAPAVPAVQQVAQAGQALQAPRGKTRDEVRRELSAARAAGCMDVPDNQYPQPCPLPGAIRSMADAFRIE